jgi:hypothetical protein
LQGEPEEGWEECRAKEGGGGAGNNRDGGGAGNSGEAIVQHRRDAPRPHALAPTSAIALLLLLRVVGRAAGAGAAPAAMAAVKGAQMSLSAAQAARTTEVQRPLGAPCMRILNRHVSWQHAHGLWANVILRALICMLALRVCMWLLPVGIWSLRVLHMLITSVHMLMRLCSAPRSLLCPCVPVL